MRTTISPSALETWALCPRKLAWKDSGVEVPPNPSALLGTKVHKVAEDYLTLGKEPDMLTREGEIFSAGMHHLPNKDFPNLVIEGEFTREFRGVTFSGRVDFSIPSIPLVGDHKTTSDYKYVRNLPLDTQANIYAWNAMETAGTDTCHLLWVYYLTKSKPSSRAVTAVLSKFDVLKHMEDYAIMGHGILKAAQAQVNPLDYPKNIDACEAYGGCPYQHLCKITPSERLHAIMATSESTAAFLAKIGAGKGINPPKPQPVTGPPEERANAFLAQLASIPNTAPLPAEPAAEPEVKAPPKGAGIPNMAALLAPKALAAAAPKAATPKATVPLASPAGQALLKGDVGLEEAGRMVAGSDGRTWVATPEPAVTFPNAGTVRRECYPEGTTQYNLSKVVLLLAEATKLIASMK